MKDMIVSNNLYLSENIEQMANDFEQAYTFNQEPPQNIVDIMFEVFVSGILVGRGERYSFTGCATSRCSSCTGSCGK
jgi:hypothetical protein